MVMFRGFISLNKYGKYTSFPLQLIWVPDMTVWFGGPECGVPGVPDS